MNKPKKIVICLDGTGNKITKNPTNVGLLFRCLPIETDNQLSYYDFGVGTIHRKKTWGHTKQKIDSIMGLATGLGIDEQVLRAYQFLVKYHSKGDLIYLFGFSRGAHAARMLAGLIYSSGILYPHHSHLCEAVLDSYKNLREVKFSNSDDALSRFGGVVRTKLSHIHFLGLWDTVSSVIIPGVTSFDLEKLAYTSVNPGVKHVRHAAAIDEKRRMFRLDRWKSDQVFKPNQYSETEEKQDFKEVWFSGVHSDIGGGYARHKSSLSKFPLIWMLEEAKSLGLLIFERSFQYLSGQKPYTVDTTFIYPKGDPKAKLNKSLSIGWWLFEPWPKANKLKECPNKKSFLGHYIPNGEPRFIEDAAVIHPSVFEKMRLDPFYNPVNLSKRHDFKEAEVEKHRS